MKQKVRTSRIAANTLGPVTIIASRFNEEVSQGLLDGALKLLQEKGLSPANIDVTWVPGAFEIPLAVKKCYKQKKVKGFLALGCVIKGESAHFEYVCQGVTYGIMQAMLDLEVPIGFGVLTTLDQKQALERCQPDEYNKGREAALALIEMISLYSKGKKQGGARG